MFLPLESNICLDVLPVETRAVNRNSVHMKTIPNNTQMQMMLVLSRLEKKMKVNLRVPDIHEAQKHSFFTFCLIFLSSHDAKNIWMILFWPKVYRWERWSQSGKMPPAGRAQIKNVKYAKSDIFNFNSTTRWHIWTFTPLFLSMDHCQKCHSDFWYVEY